MLQLFSPFWCNFFHRYNEIQNGFVKWWSPYHCAKKPVTTMLAYPWKCTVLHCNHLGNTWKPLVLMTRHFDYCPSASEGDNQSVRSSAPVVSRCFPGGYNVKLYISRGRLAWWLLAFFCCEWNTKWFCKMMVAIFDGQQNTFLRHKVLMNSCILDKVCLMYWITKQSKV